MRRGPKPQPAQRLIDAAIEYAVAVELDCTRAPKREWDRLRAAAIHYRDSDRPRGRPRRRLGTTDTDRRAGTWHDLD